MFGRVLTFTMLTLFSLQLSSILTGCGRAVSAKGGGDVTRTAQNFDGPGTVPNITQLTEIYPIPAWIPTYTKGKPCAADLLAKWVYSTNKAGVANVTELAKARNDKIKKCFPIWAKTAIPVVESQKAAAYGANRPAGGTSAAAYAALVVQKADGSWWNGDYNIESDDENCSNMPRFLAPVWSCATVVIPR